MKKRTRIEQLAFVGRVLLLLGALLGGSTVAVFAWWPATVDRLDAWLRENHTAPFDLAFAEAEAARAASDSGRERALLSALAERIGPTAKLDRQRPMAVKVLGRLVELHRGAGDSGKALACLRALRSIDPNSVWIARDLAMQLFADPALRAEAYTLLLGDKAIYGSGFAYSLPAQAEIVSPLVSALTTDGRIDEARAVLAAAANSPDPSWWSIYWWDEKYDDMKVGGCQPRVRADSVLQVDFTLRDAVRYLRILPAAFLSCRMEAPEWSVREAGSDEFRPLAIVSRDVQNLREIGSTMDLYGIADPIATFELAEPLAQGEREFRFTARYVDTYPEWILRLAISKAGPQLATGEDAAAKTLASVRRAGFATLALEVFWKSAPGTFSAKDKLRVPLAASPSEDGEASFVVDVTLPEAWDTLRVDLGSGEFASWRFARVELHDAAGAVLMPVALDTATLVHAERTGTEIVATDVDAQFQFARPKGTEQARVLRLEGHVR